MELKLAVSNPESGTGPWEHKLSPGDHCGVQMLLHDPSGVRFSLRNQSFRVDATHRYDQRGHNVSVRYLAGSSGLVSIYVYPFAPPRSVVLFDELFNAAMADVLGTMRSTSYVDERRTAFAHASSSFVLGRRCDARGLFRSGVVPKDFDAAFVELFVHHTWILKIRGTYRISFANETEQFVASWLATSAIGSE